MNTGGAASEKTLRDEFAGQALAGLCSSWYDRHKDDPETQRGHGPTLISQSAYTHAEAMLAEKARREAVVQQSLTTDHSPDATKMIELQDANRELVEALELLVKRIEYYSKLPQDQRPCIEQWEYTDGSYDMSKARAILSKHKGAA